MTTWHFRHDTLGKRPYVSEEECRRIIAAPLHVERQPDGAVRHWGEVTLPGETEPRIMRVVTRGDGETIITAFPDRDFPRRWRRAR